MLFDSHNHLQDERLRPIRGQLTQLARQDNIGRMVVNGTREQDWSEVQQLAAATPVVLPSYGLHPWYAAARSRHWQSLLGKHLDAAPAAVGEIGLDRWIQNHHLPDQEAAFMYQLRVAAERELPVTIHCLRAWGRLLELLQAGPRPSRFLLHSYGGPGEMTVSFLRLGAYFSISGHFAHPRKARQQEVFRTMPLDRLLIETDAPDMLPPEPWIRRPLPEGVNHPGNLSGVYEFTAKLREVSVETLAEQVEANFHTLFAGVC